MLAAQLQTAGGGQAELPTGGMKAAMLQGRDQIDRLQMGGALNVQGHLQGLAADIRGGSGEAQASGVLVDAQLQARVAEGVALQRQVGQLAAQSEGAELGMGDGLTGFQIEKVGGAVAQVIEIGEGQREHPLRCRDAPVIPALAPPGVTMQRAVHLRSIGPTNGLVQQSTFAVAKRLERKGRV